MNSLDEKNEDISHIEAAKEESQNVDYSGARTYITTEEKTLIRKQDFIILPTLWLMYFLNFLDRGAIAIARLDGFQKDLKLTSTQYQTCVSGLFIGYILAQIPSNMIVTRVRPSLFMSALMALWSVVSTLTGITHNFTGLFLCRFFLGVTEAPFYPCALYLLSIFYSRKEIATRIAILFTGSICGNAFSGLIAVGIFKMEGIAGLEGWRWLFILQGIISFAVAVGSAFILPDEPLRTWWLTQDQRQLAEARVTRDTVGNTSGSTVWTGLKDAMRDPKLWVFCLNQHLCVAASGFKNFFPTIVGTLGFDRTTTLLLVCPPYLVAGVISIVWSWSSGRKNERTWHMTIAAVIGVIGFVLAAATMNVGARYFAMFVFAIGVYCANAINLGWVASTCGQTKEKKSVSLAAANVCGNIATIYTPYWWPSSDGPRYEIPLSASAAAVAVFVLGIWAMRIMLVRANRKIRQTESEATVFFAY